MVTCEIISAILWNKYQCQCQSVSVSQCQSMTTVHLEGRDTHTGQRSQVSSSHNTGGNHQRELYLDLSNRQKVEKRIQHLCCLECEFLEGYGIL